MKKCILISFMYFSILSGTAFGEYRQIPNGANQNSLYFKTDLIEVDGIIYTTIFENFVHPRAITNKSSLKYSSEASTLRLRCKDNYVSMVDGQKFSEPNMQGTIVGYEKPLPESKTKWSPIPKPTVNNEPYASMIKTCHP